MEAVLYLAVIAVLIAFAVLLVWLRNRSTPASRTAKTPPPTSRHATGGAGLDTKDSQRAGQPKRDHRS